MNKNYHIGLDVGSDSVGWAVSDDDFNLLELNGKTAWGARLFDKASSAKERRAFRSARRRNARKRYRIYLLNKYIFEKEILKIDPSFFIRLSESNYHLDDKSTNIKYPLFPNEKEESEFYKKYPTIYHLRRAQINDEPGAFKDIRYLYLTIHHIIKKRGNFLHEGRFEFKDIDVDLIENANRAFNDILESEEEINLIDNELVLGIFNILEQDENKKTKQNQVKQKFKEFDDDEFKNYRELFAALVSGGEFALKKIFGDDVGNEKIKFDSAYDEKYPNYQTIFGDYIAIVDLAKTIYDRDFIKTIMGDKKYLSDAMIDVYDKHKKDLLDYQTWIKTNKPKSYNDIFATKKDSSDNKEDLPSYKLFIHNPNKNKLEDLNKNIIKFIGKPDESDKLGQDIIHRCEKGNFLARIADVKGSEFPHQFHQIELEKILNNASKYFPFIQQEKDKILSIFFYKLKFYEGPLWKDSKYTNVVRNEGFEDEKILPWNKDKIIDASKTKAKFMDSLTNYCTYLRDETVLPKSSILYSDFVALNILNTIKINGDRILQECKKDLFENLISVNPSITISAIKKYLNKNEVYKNDKIEISGVDASYKFDCSTRATLGKVFNLKDKKQLEKVEDIIKILTIFADNKLEGVEIATSKYDLNDEQIKAIKRINISKWGTLSKKLLTEKWFNDNTGEVKQSIIDLLYETTLNFQEILNDKHFNFLDIIREQNEKSYGEATKHQRIDELIQEAPPMMRRPAIQALKIISEINKITKSTPKTISIETTRENPKKEKKGKKRDPRYEELKKFINGLKSNKKSGFPLSELKELNDELVNHKLDVKGKALYLYFKQLSYDLYTGKKIDIDKVISGETYDIDHIIPQNKIKDDSLDNLVLVERYENQKVKKDIYPLPQDIQIKQYQLWKRLRSINAISEEKYSRLIRKTELTEDELNAFINRQINVVNHSNILLANVLKIAYPNAEIIFNKAENVSFVRNRFGIVKVRELNDTHHAVDAYLNIVVGNILNKYYTKKFYLRSKESVSNNNGEKETYNPETVLENKLKYWPSDKKDNSKRPIDKIKTICEGQDMLITMREQYNDGAFYNQNIVANPSKSGTAALIPVHTKSKVYARTDKYGGYSNLAPAYFVIGANSEGDKELIDVPIMFDSKYKKHNHYIELLKEYINEKGAKLNNELAINSKSTIEIGGYRYLLTNFNTDVVTLTSFEQVFLNSNCLSYLKIILKNIDVLSKLDSTLEEYYYFTDKEHKNKIVISKKDNELLRDNLISTMNSPKFFRIARKKMIAKFFKNLLDENYSNFSLYEQAHAIVETINALNRVHCKYTKSKNNILNQPEVYLLKQSATGLFEKKIKL